MKLNFRFLLVLVLFAGLVPLNLVRGDAAKPHLVVDTDMGLDDVRALFALLGTDQVELESIVVTGGAASLAKGVEHAIEILESMDLQTINVVSGIGDENLIPPPWRSTADKLGEIPIPHPQNAKETQNQPEEVKEQTSELVARLGDTEDRVQYLALGPLSTLVYLLRETSFKAAIDTLWIPGKLSESGSLKDWNLTWNSDATQVVFQTVEKIVLIDLSSWSGTSPVEFFSSVNEECLAGRWIHALLKSSKKKPHLDLYDELAAAALIQKDSMVILEEDRWNLLKVGDDKIQLTPSPDGKIMRAVFNKKVSPLDILRTAYECPSAPR